MKQRFLLYVVACTLAVPLTLASVGGWAVITVEDVPEHLVAGRPVDLSVTVRQHGVEPMRDATPRVELRSGKLRHTVPARAGKKAGQYDARVAAPSAGNWTMTIYSGFRDSEVTLLPINAVAAGSPAPRPLASVTRGKHLFVAKGCVTCHVHSDVEGSGRVAVGPDLTKLRFARTYLAQYLADPSIKPPTTNFGRMPDLGLKPAEIDALVSFINTGVVAASEKN